MIEWFLEDGYIKPAIIGAGLINLLLIINIIIRDHAGKRVNRWWMRKHSDD